MSNIDNYFRENSVGGLSCDIEFSFIGLKIEDLKNIFEIENHPDFSFEDKSDLGWGSVISRDDDIFLAKEELSSKIVDILIDFKIEMEKVKNLFPAVPISLRLGIYYSTWNLTIPISLDLVRLLSDLRIELDVSVYQSDE